MEEGTHFAFTITLGDQGENHVGMEKIGSEAEAGISYLQLLGIYNQIKDTPNQAVEFYDLKQLLPDTKRHLCDPAAIMVIRSGVNYLLDTPNGDAHVLRELKSMSYDKTVFNAKKNKVTQKHARWNNTIDDEASEPDIENGKGTVVSFHEFPFIAQLRHRVREVFGIQHPLVGEVNYYYNAFKCAIMYHGDAERKIVVGIRSGNIGIPLRFCWFQNSLPISKFGEIDLGVGDVYVMSEKAVGTDWLRSSLKTLRHAAGLRCTKYYEMTCVQQGKCEEPEGIRMTHY